MNQGNNFFTPQEHMVFEGIVADAKKAALLIPLQLLALSLALVGLAGVVVIDWEIYYRIFEYLADGQGYWSPRLMACTGIIMIAAFHLLAEDDAAHPIVRLVTLLAGVIIAAFVIGGGLYIAAILYGDGMGQQTGSVPVIPALGELPGVIAESGWIDVLFDSVTRPVAILSLSLGIGGLSIVALFIAHHLITLIRKSLHEVFTRSKALRAALYYHRAIQAAEARLGELHDRQNALAFEDEDHWKLHLANQALEVVADHLMPHEQALQEWDYQTPVHRWGQGNAEDNKQMRKRVEAAVKALRAITLDDILQALSLPKTLRRLS